VVGAGELGVVNVPLRRVDDDGCSCSDSRRLTFGFEDDVGDTMFA